MTLKFMTRALQIVGSSSNVEIVGVDNLIYKIIGNFSNKVNSGQFFVHQDLAHDVDVRSKEAQLIRGVLYYLQEDLPYIPPSLQAEWFDTEVKMVELAI